MCSQLNGSLIEVSLKHDTIAHFLSGVIYQKRKRNMPTREKKTNSEHHCRNAQCRSFVCLVPKKTRLIHRDQVRSGSMGGEIEIKSARKKWLKSNIKNAIKTKRTPENIRNAYVLPRAWFFSCCFSCTPMQIASHKSSMKCKNPMITLRIGEKEITNTTQHRRRKKESQPILV